MSTRWQAHRLMAAGLTVFVACGSSAREPEPAAAASPSPRPAQSPQYQTGSLDQIMAPIALYPDQLLAQILMSAGEPAKVAELEAWLKANATLKGTELQNAAVKAGFEPSFVALALFPQVVTTMAEQIAWTTMMGQAFMADKTAVFNSIQKLRQQARNVGTLKTNAQQEVETKTTSTGEQVIVIEPANPQIIYVPQYNTEVVYTQAPTTTTVIVEDNHDEAIAAGLIGFTAGIAIGASMNNNYYYGPYGWHGGAYMYNDAWNDYYDHREDAREDWMDHREDMNEDRSERRENTAEQRTDRQENRAENRPETQQQRTERQQNRQENPTAARQQAQTAAQNRAASGTQSARTGSTEARGYGDGARTQSTRSGGSDAFSGYSSGSSQRAASSRGQSSRSSSRGSRGGGGGGGRRR